MINYREKLFSSRKAALKSAGKYIKDHPLLPLSAVTATVSTANFITNKNRDKKDKVYQEKHLETMKNLTDSLDSFTDKISSKTYSREKKKKSFSLKDDVVKGAVTGAGIGLTVANLFRRRGNKSEEIDKSSTPQAGVITKPKDSLKNRLKERIPSFKAKSKDTFKEIKTNPDYVFKKTISGVKGAVLDIIQTNPDFAISLLGAGIGAIIGSLSWVTKTLSHSTSERLMMKDITKSLTKLGYKEDVDFTKNARIADLLKTKVCLVFSRSHTEMKILINSVNDASLNKLLEKSLKQELPTNYSSSRRKSGERFNEITITSISTEHKKDKEYLIKLIDLFIKSKYPVYIVEVG